MFAEVLSQAETERNYINLSKICRIREYWWKEANLENLYWNLKTLIKSMGMVDRHLKL